MKLVIGVDPHKQSHTAAAVDRATGELQSSETVAACPAGHGALLAWARALGDECVWATANSGATALTGTATAS